MMQIYKPFYSAVIGVYLQILFCASACGLSAADPTLVTIPLNISHRNYVKIKLRLFIFFFCFAEANSHVTSAVTDLRCQSCHSVPRYSSFQIKTGTRREMPPLPPAFCSLYRTLNRARIRSDPDIVGIKVRDREFKLFLQAMLSSL